MVSRGRVLVVSNDLVPGMGLAVAAPGLRAHGLAEGLRAHDFTVTVLVVREAVDLVWRDRIPPARVPGVEVVTADRLMPRLRSEAPAVVVMINANQVDHLEPADGLTFVLDFFAPRMLERAHRDDGPYPATPLQRLEEQKIRALRLCDAVIVNGRRKVPYYEDWIQKAGRGDDRLPLRVVEMPVALRHPAAAGGGPLRVIVAGYLQPWSPPGPWLRVLAARLGESLAADTVVARHWGGPEANPPATEIEQFLAHPRVRAHPPLRFSEFREVLAQAHLAVDLFPRTPEREYAMVTRTVVALASGLPVIHPPFTEVSPLIEEYGAGWLLEADDLAALDEVLAAVIGDRAGLRSRAGGARRLAEEHFEPAAAVRPLVEILEST